MKQSLLLLEAHQATVQIENIIHAMQVDLWYGGNHAKMKQNVLLLFGCLN